jgi:hypothetical protein
MYSAYKPFIEDINKWPSIGLTRGVETQKLCSMPESISLTGQMNPRRQRCLSAYGIILPGSDEQRTESSFYTRLYLPT